MASVLEHKTGQFATAQMTTATVAPHQHNVTAQDGASQDEPRLRRLSVTEYDQMIEVGIFGTNDRVELLEGVLIEMSPKSFLHAAANEDAADFFKALLGRKSIVRSQNPIRLDDFSEPEPDIVLLKPPKHKYYERHPTPDDVQMIMEIADSSLRKDRHLKNLSYAKAGIKQYLILNVKTREIEDYREPDADGYRFKKVYTAEESFQLVAFPKLDINVLDLLPPVKEADASTDKQPHATRTRSKQERTKQTRGLK